MYKGQKVGVVVPAYNEELLIAEMLSGVPECVDAIFVINDGSQDATLERVHERQQQDGS